MIGSGTHAWHPVQVWTIILQEKELKGFKDKQKQDRKLMQQEFDMLAKTAKKDDVRKRKEQKEIQLQEEVCRPWDYLKDKVLMWDHAMGIELAVEYRFKKTNLTMVVLNSFMLPNQKLYKNILECSFIEYPSVAWKVRTQILQK